MTQKTLVSIVDDDQSFRDSLRRLLRSLGYPVESFASAADFLASPKLDATGCLVADVQMPKMTGLELVSHLVNAGREIPTILITAYPEGRVQKRMLSLGVRCYLPKPLEENVFIRCVRSAFARGVKSRAT